MKRAVHGLVFALVTLCALLSAQVPAQADKPSAEAVIAGPPSAKTIMAHYLNARTYRGLVTTSWTDRAHGDMTLSQTIVARCDGSGRLQALRATVRSWGDRGGAIVAGDGDGALIVNGSRAWVVDRLSQRFAPTDRRPATLVDALGLPSPDYDWSPARSRKEDRPNEGRLRATTGRFEADLVYDRITSRLLRAELRDGRTLVATTSVRDLAIDDPSIDRRAPSLFAAPTGSQLDSDFGGRVEASLRLAMTSSYGR